MSFEYYLSRLLRAIVSVVLTVTFVFIIMRVSGDPVATLIGDRDDPYLVEYYTEKFGLDRPVYVQYLQYFENVLRGDLGMSWLSERQATSVVFERVPNTILLGLTSFFFSLIVAIPVGMYTALHRGETIDRIVMGFAVFGFSMPNFFLGILLIMLFSLNWALLPSFGSGTVAHLVMPVLTLALVSIGTLARFSRSAMLEVLNQPYMRTAKAKGAPHRRRIYWHALPNAIIPIITILGFRIGHLIAGAVVVETVFAWPGVGRLLVSSVRAGDLPVVQVIVILTATAMVCSNLLVDYLYGVVDPRIRRRQMGES